MAEIEKMKRTEMSAAEPQSAVGNPNQAARPQNAVGNPSPNLKSQAQPRELAPPIMEFAPDTPSPNRATSEELYGPRSLSQSQSISYRETSGPITPIAHVDTREMERNLRDMNEAAKKQQTAAIDQATRSNAEQLRIAEREAQAQYDEQRRQTSFDERQAMDNSALYAAARGDRGGVGQAQYNAIQANAARNRASIGQAQTKLSTDVTRQIADLRRQGEFKKADALLTLSQQYLSQLNDLKRWATETNIGIDQANNALAQWERGFEMDLAGITGQYQGQDTLQKAQIDYQRGQDAINNAIREAGLTGVYNGQDTLEKAQIDYQRGQDAINNAIREAGLTGMYNGQATMGKAQIDLENQRYEDETAYQRGQDAINNAIREAGLTGLYNGQATLEKAQLDLENARYEDETAYQRGQDAINNAIREAGLTGVYNGQKTLDAKEAEYQRDLDSLNMSIKQQSLDADSGFSLLEAGQMPNATQLKAMGWTSGQAQKYINDAKALKAATDAASAAGDTSKVANLGWKSLDAGIMPNKEQLSAMGMTSASAKAYIDRILKEDSDDENPQDTKPTTTATTTPQTPKEPMRESYGVLDPLTGQSINRTDPRIRNVRVDSNGNTVYTLNDGRILYDYTSQAPATLTKKTQKMITKTATK